MKDYLVTPWIDQPALSDACPCKSGKCFGSCCGYDYSCDCNSKLTAVECCYKQSAEEQAKGNSQTKQRA